MKSVRVLASSYETPLYCSRCSLKRSISWTSSSGRFSMKPPRLVLYTKRGTCNLEQICGQASRPAHPDLLSCRLAKTSLTRYTHGGGYDLRCDATTIRRADGSGDRVPVHHQVKERGAGNGHEQTTTEASYRSHNHSRASCGGSWPHVARIEQSPLPWRSGLSFAVSLDDSYACPSVSSKCQCEGLSSTPNVVILLCALQ